MNDLVILRGSKAHISFKSHH